MSVEQCYHLEVRESFDQLGTFYVTTVYRNGRAVYLGERENCRITSFADACLWVSIEKWISEKREGGSPAPALELTKGS